MEFSLKLDSIIFLISTLLIVIILLSKKIGYKSKLFYIITFIAFNSSYNIMIKPIHDYNKVVPRNFIWHKDIISSFKLYDIIFIIIFIFTIKQIFGELRYKLFRNIFKREVFLIVVGIISYFATSGYFLDGGKNFIICMKGIIYFFGAFLFAKKYFVEDIEEVNYIKIFGIILVFGFASLLFFNRQYLWVRYGNTVKIIDQEDAYTISLLIITFYYIKFRVNKQLKDLFLFLLFFIQNLLCVYKMNIVFYIYMILFVELFIGKKRFINIKFIMLSLLGVITLLISSSGILNMINSAGIITRGSQMKDLWDYMVSKGIYSVMFGIGPGSPYYSLFNNGDFGEIKAIDNVYTGYRFGVQTPILSVIKIAGIIGLIVYLYYTIKVMIYLLKQIKNFRNNIELISLSAIFTFHFIFCNSGFTLTGNAPMPIFYGIILGRIVYIMKNERGLDNENINIK